MDPLNRGQRRLQLVAHHAQELGPQPLQILERGQVLEGHDEGLQFALFGADGRSVQQRGDRAAIGNPDHDLLGANRLPRAERLGHRQFLQGDLAAVGAAEGQDAQESLRGLVRLVQAADDSCGLAVERHQRPGPCVEHHDPDGSGLDQRFEVGPGPSFVAVAAGVGDDQRRLGGEHDQGVLVIGRELLAVFPHCEIDVAGGVSAVADRRSKEGAGPLRADGNPAGPRPWHGPRSRGRAALRAGC